jgi:hypothetical protein
MGNETHTGASLDERVNDIQDIYARNGGFGKTFCPKFGRAFIPHENPAWSGKKPREHRGPLEFADDREASGIPTHCPGWQKSMKSNACSSSL